MYPYKASMGNKLMMQTKTFINSRSICQNKGGSKRCSRHKRSYLPTDKVGNARKIEHETTLQITKQMHFSIPKSQDEGNII